LAAHTTPHAPQFWGLVAVFVHVPAHIVPAQVEEQTEFEQKGAVVGQALPQRPQLLGFDVRSIQALVLHFSHTGAAPPDPPAPGALPLPLPLAPPGVGVGELAEQLIAKMAGNASVSRPPTNCGRKELGFSRNRFHIGAPNLKVRKVAKERHLGATRLASLCWHCSA
jgi:hypothetical protein